jgi:phosphatidylinositol alpha-1,6-mannosyltransferase
VPTVTTLTSCGSQPSLKGCRDCNCYCSNEAPIKFGTAVTMTERVLLLTPSRGRGGGIERYSETLEWAFAEQGVECKRIDLNGSRVSAHARMLARGRKLIGTSRRPTRLVLTHRALLPVASLLAKAPVVCGISVVCHGNDVWGARPVARRSLEKHLMRGAGVRVVAVSSFTAGALAEGCHAGVLPPGLSRGWFDTLVDGSARVRSRDTGVHLVTAFRLDQWRNKGLPELLDAVAALSRPDIHVTICGTGEPPQELRGLVHRHPRSTLRPGVTDGELARELAAADLFVLATRTKAGRHASGEGFGLVLLEAQVAGTPVIGPAFGGSHDAYLDGVTGIAPTDETAGALARLLDELLQDPCRLQQMGKRSAEWARECFAPEHYASRAIGRLL